MTKIFVDYPKLSYRPRDMQNSKTQHLHTLFHAHQIVQFNRVTVGPNNNYRNFVLSRWNSDICLDQQNVELNWSMRSDELWLLLDFEPKTHIHYAIIVWLRRPASASVTITHVALTVNSAMRARSLARLCGLSHAIFNFTITLIRIQKQRPSIRCILLVSRSLNHHQWVSVMMLLLLLLSAPSSKSNPV